MKPIKTILVANRGEIAIRIMRTAQALGYRTVAVYSDPDSEMPHVRTADFAVPLNAVAATESYLDIDKLIAAAKLSEATAIHPGYGFLSENANFADACAAEGITFIGPSAEVMRAMADKAEAKKTLRNIGVPCIPGYDGDDQTEATLMREAEKIGYPVMLKSTAGGGGKGMRWVEAPDQLGESIRVTRSEALKAFGSDNLLLEKALVMPRHVEVQVFGDNYGNAIYLGDRDCSIQRRHQKIIEEAPAPGLSSKLRESMGQAAVTAAKAIKYSGAGTIEFMLAPSGEFYFLEMNTRLQVEHPVTELVTGIDLVEWQFRVAAGEVLPLSQDQVNFDGHAIEARLYAEDPESNFLPQSGKIVDWQPPSDVGIRVDHGLVKDSVISTFYDPLLAKVVGHGRDRAEAGRRLVRGIENFVVSGIKTNRTFLIECLTVPAFDDGVMSTSFLDNNGLLERSVNLPDARDIAMASVLFHRRDVELWGGNMHGWRSRPWKAEPTSFDVAGQNYTATISETSCGFYIVHCDEHDVEVAVLSEGDRTWLRVDRLEKPVDVIWSEDALHLSQFGSNFVFRKHTKQTEQQNIVTNRKAIAPMAGVIGDLKVSEGDLVDEGDLLLTLEAMKLELPIQAPMGGVLSAIHIEAGQHVAIHQVLVEIDPATEGVSVK